MSDEGRTVLLISDHRLTDSGGRAERFQTRTDQLREYGWSVELGYVPEPYITGFPRAVVRLTRLARREDIDVVNSVSNPFHLHIIGFLVSLFARVPWLVEFRDPMVTNPDLNGDPLMPLRRFVEWFSVHFSDKVVWGDGIQIEEDYYESKYSVSGDKITRLPFAGYNEAAFKQADSEDYDLFTLTYAGSFYPGWIEPYNFLAGLDWYVSEFDPDPFQVQFYGDWIEAYQREAQRRGVAQYIETYDFVPHDAIVPVLKGSDVLLYMSGTDDENERNVPSKIMDYIGARSPMLSLSPESFRVSDIVRDNEFGVVADPNDPQEIAEKIDTIRRGGPGLDPAEVAFEEFTRQRKSERVADVLDALVE